MLAARRARAQICRVTDGNAYTEHRLKVARTARWGVLGTLGPLTTDVWLILHGYGQLAGDFASSARWPVAPGRALVFVEALQRFYIAEPNTTHATAPIGASWMTRDARHDDIEDNHAYLDHVTDEVLKSSPRARFAVLGFSQGAATAARWAEARARNRRAPARLLLWGALMPPELDIGPSAPLRDTSVVYVCGTRDKWVTPVRIAGERARLDAAEFPYQFVEFTGGHRLNDETLTSVISAL